MNTIYSSYKALIEEQGFFIASPKGESMLPLIREGIDKVKIVKVNRKLKKYDVILYKRKNNQIVLHRIVKVLKSSYILCGDNQFTLEKNITDDMIIGVMDGFYRDEEYVSNDNPLYIKYYKKKTRNNFRKRLVHNIKNIFKIKVNKKQ